MPLDEDHALVRKLIWHHVRNGGAVDVTARTDGLKTVAPGASKPMRLAELESVLQRDANLEEKHAVMALEWIRRRDPVFDKASREGAL